MNGGAAAAPDDLLDRFAAHFGRPADGEWSAPGRVNLVGEHTDYNGGASLPFAIDRRARVAVALRGDRTVRVVSTIDERHHESSLDTLAEAAGWAAYVLGVAWAIGQEHALDDKPGFDLLLDSAVPVGVGVSSSAAIEAAVCVALDELWGLGLARDEMVRLCRRAENEVVGAPTGTLDQSAVLFAEPDAAVLLDFGTGASEIVPLGFEAAELDVLVVDSTIGHDHAVGEYGERRRECEAAAAALGSPLGRLTPAELDRRIGELDPLLARRARHIVTDTARTFEVARMLRAGRADEIGPLLTASHVSQRDDFGTSVPAIDVAVEAAVEAGALGARLTGGGFGGASIALVRRADAERVRDAVTRAVTQAGHPRPEIFTARASGGARRER
ncbi:galactokinase [Pseudoclavibacter chungangensis]|uniref:Galactokinase n=1 Tax=Pseudoclavibacter chungangensis TaxID=587635 RepID=A0A7J5BNV1_9MICO|nr:galactokinase [Pseudoclavibacter chungangensis]